MVPAREASERTLKAAGYAELRYSDNDRDAALLMAEDVQSSNMYKCCHLPAAQVQTGALEIWIGRDARRRR